MMPGPLVSICIPTYKRPDFLSEALDSCFAQTYSPYEILVGDDSPDGDTATLVARYDAANPGKLRYFHNKPSLGQNLNVNALFACAQGDRLVLLHDDDLLLPDALEKLAACWQSHPELDAAFGKQYLIRNDGSPCPQAESDNLNAGYHRVTQNAGSQAAPASAGITGMFPNDGYMVTTALARKIGYRTMEEVGAACDMDFGARLCIAAKHVWFLDDFIASYRLSDDSVGKHALPSPYTLKILSELAVPEESKAAWRQAKQHYAPAAVSGYARQGMPRQAIRVYLSKDYPMKQRFSPRGFYHLLLILKSIVR